jgi:pyruvate formate lyase activating enzyme
MWRKPAMNAGIKSVAVTAGYVCAEPRDEYYQYLDTAYVDLKSFTKRFFHEVTVRVQDSSATLRTCRHRHNRFAFTT